MTHWGDCGGRTRRPTSAGMCCPRMTSGPRRGVDDPRPSTTPSTRAPYTPTAGTGPNADTRVTGRQVASRVVELVLALAEETPTLTNAQRCELRALAARVRPG